MRKVVIFILLAVLTVAIMGCGGSHKSTVKIIGSINNMIDGSMVKIYFQRHMYDEQYLVVSTIIQDDGTFELYAPEGIYDIVAMYPYGDNPVQWAPTEMPDISVTSPVTDLGEITLAPPPAD